MGKEKVSATIDRTVRREADKKANELGISRARFIELALESELGRFNVHKENKRLTEKARLSEEMREQDEQRYHATLQELNEKLTTAESEIAELTELREEVYDQLDTEIDKVKVAEDNLKQVASHLGVPDTVKHCKQRIDELQESIEDKKKERDHFKAKFEDAESKARGFSEKLSLLETRTWWERLWNIIPWKPNERSWNKPSRPITPTPAEPDDTGE